MNAVINWTLGGVAAMVIGGAGYLLDGPSELQALADQAAAVRDAERAERAEQRFATAAAALCASTVGQNSGWSRIDDHTVQCHTKRGHKLSKVTL